jgi:hypothetical protein
MGGTIRENSKGYVVFVFKGMWQFYLGTVLYYGVHIYSVYVYQLQHQLTTLLMCIMDYSQGPFI